MFDTRAGFFKMQPTGYKAFVPKPLPPDPPIAMDMEMISLLSLADRKLGRLDGVTTTLPNPDLFVAMYVQKEAVLSSQIEGTQASLIDVLSTGQSEEKKADIDEVIHYVKAMNYGLERLTALPLSLRLLREIHAILLEQGRGSIKAPGEFRTTQNWIGSSSSSLADAAFVPPAVSDMHDALYGLELFLYEEDHIPALIKIALIHAQFETIHPFLDGNGRMGRLLITFWLCQQGILSKPLLYLSYFFKQHRAEYYDRLTAIRTRGDWEGWLKFFLKGIAEVSDEATSSARMILALKERYSSLLHAHTANNANHQKLFEKLFDHVVVSKTQVASMIDVTFPTASALIETFCEIGILKDFFPNRKRDKLYCFQEYIDILSKGT